ncbi:type II secretion system F family protein [Desulfococcus sp.]|uniref:type II secretion system F family protein n=1 Tax=Desulfococcus sp. TaxID=2025834 RepID=UPI0035931019
MAKFVWTARNRRGIAQNGQIDAASLEVARSQLIKKGLSDIKIKEKPKDLLDNISFLQPSVTNKDIIIFCRQFSTMIDAGLPIIQCLELLAAQSENKTFVNILKEVKEDLEGGATLADALKKHPKEFNDLFVNMVAAGEAGGILDAILKRLSETLEKAERLKAKVKSAMLYPAITLAVAVIVVIVIMIFVIPVFQKMFGEMGQALPSMTMMVIHLSEFTKDNIFYMVIAAGLLGFMFRKYYGTDKGRRIIDRFLLKLPVMGSLIRKVAVAKFTRTMGTMLSSGVAILDGLDIVAKTAGNKIVETAIYGVRSSIKEGQTMAAPLAGSGVFPPMVCSMIAVGESTGALDSMMVKIADFYDEEVDEAVERLTEMIEPFMICFLGVVVGGVVIAMYLPIFSMASGIS